MSDNDQQADVPEKKGLAAVVADDFSVWQAVGGIRGLTETVLPSILFITVFTATGETIPAVIGAVVVVVLSLGVRLFQRIDLTPALGGAVGVAISAVWAWRSGEAENFFAIGLWTNGAYLTVLLISILATWPLIGVAVALLRGEDQSWRTDPAQAARRRRYYTATWLWVCLFGTRLAVQLPLYLADDQVGALGIARIIMGPFLFALVAWLTWVLCREPENQIVIGASDSQPDRDETAKKRSDEDQSDDR